MHYHGVQLPLLPSGRAPLLLAAVHGTDHHGRPFRWVARRHRKVLAQEHACPTPPPPLSWAACLDVRTQAGKLGWWVALLFTLGSALFIVSGVAGEFEALADPTTDPAGLRSPSAALLRWPNLVAANLCFFPAGIMQARRGKAWAAKLQTVPAWQLPLLPLLPPLPRCFCSSAALLACSSSCAAGNLCAMECYGSPISGVPAVPRKRQHGPSRPAASLESGRGQPPAAAPPPAADGS